MLTGQRGWRTDTQTIRQPRQRRGGYTNGLAGASSSRVEGIRLIWDRQTTRLGTRRSLVQVQSPRLAEDG